MMNNDAVFFAELSRKIRENTATAEELRAFLEMVEKKDQLLLLPVEEWQQSIPQEVPAAVKQRILQAAAGKKAPAIKHIARRWLPYAAAVLLLVAVRLFLPRQAAHRPQYITAATGDGQIRKVWLPDSSVVMLNARSSVRYRSSFEGTDREVYLDGEAFFDVRQYPARPFIVHAGHLQTQVLGTSFNIRSYAGEKPLVAVLTGKVKVADSAGVSMILSLGEQAVYDHSRFVHYTEDPQQMSSWQHGVINMNNLTMREVATILERWYSVRITLASPEIAAYILSGTQTNTSLPQTLESICFIFNLQYQQTGNNIRISKK